MRCVSAAPQPFQPREPSPGSLTHPGGGFRPTELVSAHTTWAAALAAATAIRLTAGS